MAVVGVVGTFGDARLCGSGAAASRASDHGPSYLAILFLSLVESKL